MNAWHTTMNRRTILGAAAGSLAATALSGCSGGAGEPVGGSTAGQAGWPTYVAPPVVGGARTSTVAGVPPMYTTPLKEFFASVAEPPGDGSEVTTFQILWGTPPQDEANNLWLQELNKRLNMTYKASLGPSSSYADQFATMLASGDLPELIFVQDSTPQGLQAITDGALLDLSELLAGDNVLEWPNLANIRTETWQVSSKDGRIYGIPNENAILSRFPAVRSDALAAVGASDLGSSPEEFLERFVAMGELKKLHDKEFYALAGLGDLTTVVEWMFGIGPEWQLDETGKLRSKFQHPRYPEVVAYLRQFWDKGAVYPDPTGQLPPDMFIGGQVGFTMDAYNGFFLVPLLRQLRNNTPGADADFFVPPTASDAELTVVRDEGYWSIVGISSQVTDPQRQKLLLRLLNWFRSPFGSQEYSFINDGIEGVHYTKAADGTLTRLNDEAAENDRQALCWLGVSPVNGNYLIPADLTDKADNFYSSVETLAAAAVPSPIAGLYSEAASRSSGKRWDVRNDYLNGMYYGRRPTTDYPAFLEAWLAAGGTEALADFQAQLDSRGPLPSPSSSPS